MRAALDALLWLPSQIWAFARFRPIGFLAALVLLLWCLAAAFADTIATHDPLAHNIPNRLHPPSGDFYLGTDTFGRDAFSRIIHGARVSLYIGVSSAFIATLLGALIGIVSGLKGGWLDLVIQRLLDALLAFPPLLVAMLVVAGFGPSSNALLIALAAAFTPIMARLSRSLTVGLKQEAFVMKSVVHGSGTARLLLRHLLPNSLGPITVLGAALVGEAVAIEAGMSFLGLGVPPPDPSWGRMVQEAAHQFLETAPWLTLFPALAIALAVFSVNFFADALRDLLDPITRQSSGR